MRRSEQSPREGPSEEYPSNAFLWTLESEAVPLRGRFLTRLSVYAQITLYGRFLCLYLCTVDREESEERVTFSLLDLSLSLSLSCPYSCPSVHFLFQARSQNEAICLFPLGNCTAVVVVAQASVRKKAVQPSLLSSLSTSYLVVLEVCPLC